MVEASIWEQGNGHIMGTFQEVSRFLPRAEPLKKARWVVSHWGEYVGSFREPLFSESGLTLRAKVGRQLSKHAARREALPAL